MELDGVVCPSQRQAITISSALVRYWNFWVDLALASRTRDLCHEKIYPTWFEPAAGYRSWLAASDLYSEHLPMGQCPGQGFILLAGLKVLFPQCHNGSVFTRIEHMCLYRSILRGSWCSKWEDSQYLRPQLPASRTVSQNRTLHHVILDPCANNNPVPKWWL